MTDKETDEKEEKDIVYHTTFFNSRYITFILFDGERFSLSYSLLPTIKFEPGDEKNIIIMTFPSHTVTLTGYRLEPLCKDLENWKIRSIKVSDERYKEDNDKNPFVTGIDIQFMT